LEFDAKGKALEKSLIRLSESKGPNQQTQSSAAAISAKQSIA
jgi:hypothetical protein